ncbi:hypothetical protein [Oscillibacter sp.]|nr:hypothetical protein [Oscillibacter sp.]MDD3347215.1 hypothetical protein [Oscillibacter sp.]
MAIDMVSIPCFHGRRKETRQMARLFSEEKIVQKKHKKFQDIPPVFMLL